MYEYDDQLLKILENNPGKATETEGYFPGSKNAYAEVGVTIGTGVDLGTKTKDNLRVMGVSEKIIAKLSPFLGMKGKVAENNAKKLKITESEARQLDQCILNYFKTDLERNLEKEYPGKFKSLSKEMKSVLLSLKYQHGSVHSYNENYVKVAMSGDIDKCIKILRSSDKFTERRTYEADYLEASKMNQEIYQEERKNDYSKEKKDMEDSFASYFSTLEQKRKSLMFKNNLKEQADYIEASQLNQKRYVERKNVDNQSQKDLDKLHYFMLTTLGQLKDSLLPKNNRNVQTGFYEAPKINQERNQQERKNEDNQEKKALDDALFLKTLGLLRLLFKNKIANRTEGNDNIDNHNKPCSNCGRYH